MPGTLPTTTTNPFGGPAGSGYFDNPGSGDADIYACRDCSYTNWFDLGSGLSGQEQSRSLNAILTNELSNYANGLWTYGSNGGLKGRMLAAETNILASFSSSYAPSFFATLQGFKSAIETYPGAAGKIGINTPTPKNWTIAFRPIQARARTRALSHPYIWQPMLFRQTRFRGARSFCAMREAARKQRATNDNLISLGPQSLGTWWLWNYGNGESTVKVAAPVRDLTASGANVFVIPIAVGAKVSPLSGALIPPLREVVHPLVWVTGDAEVQQNNYPDSWNQWVNSQHVDFWAGQYVEDAGVTIDPLLLMSWGGFINFYASGSMLMTMGKPVDGRCGSGVHSDLGDGRGGWASDASCSANPGLLSRSQWWDPEDGSLGATRPSEYASDAPLGIRGGVFPQESDGSHWPWRAPLPVAWGMNERWLANDDRSVVLSDTVTTTLGLTVAAEVNFGPVHLGVEADASLSAETRQLTTVRDHMSLSKGAHMLPIPYDQPNEYGNSILPQTSIVASSETFNTINIDPLTITGRFEMSISLPFGNVNVHWSQEFYSAPDVTPVNNDPTGQSSESQRLRVGQYSDWGNDFTEEGTTGRVVMSHLSTPANPPAFFASWPWDNPGDPRDVPACLLDSGVTADPPPPPLQQNPTVPPGEMCAYGPSSPCFGSDIQCTATGLFCEGFSGWQLPGNACNAGVMAQWLSQFSGAEYNCFSSMLEYLCSGTHQQQSWGQDGSVVARVIQHPADDEAIAQIYYLCVDQLVKAGNPSNAADAQCLTEQVAQYFKMHPCTANATLTGTAP
jgi:hypothetical protein